MLDIRTLVFVMSGIFLVSGLMVLLFHLQFPKIKGGREWAIGMGAMAFGMVLLFIRGYISDFLSIVISNVSIVLGNALLIVGVQHYLGLKPSWKPLTVILVIVCGAFSFLYQDNTYLIIRIHIASLAFFTLFTISAYLLLRAFIHKRQQAYLIAGIGFALEGMICVFRSISTLLHNHSPEQLMSPNEVSAVFFSAISFAHVITTLGIIMLITNRIQDHLNQSINESLVSKSKLANMGEMIATIAHQWRQPLAQLNGTIINLDYDYENKALNQNSFHLYRDNMENLVEYMSATVDDFTKFFHPKKEKTTVNLSNLLSNAKEMLKGNLEQFNIQLLIESPKTLHITTYSSELMQVIFSLVYNARDAFIHNKIDAPRITIKANQVGNKLVIDVQDNAGGVPKEIQYKIFDPYFTTKHQSQGTGLGLYIAKLIVENSMQGELTLKHQNKGAIFSISLPLDIQENSDVQLNSI